MSSQNRCGCWTASGRGSWASKRTGAEQAVGDGRNLQIILDLQNGGVELPTHLARLDPNRTPIRAVIRRASLRRPSQIICPGALPASVAIDVQSLNTMSQRYDHVARAVPGDPFVPGNFEERGLTASIGDENAAGGEDLDTSKPPNTHFRQVSSLHRPPPSPRSGCHAARCHNPG